MCLLFDVVWVVITLAFWFCVFNVGLGLGLRNFCCFGFYCLGAGWGVLLFGLLTLFCELVWVCWLWCF